MFCGQTPSGREEETRCAVMAAAGFSSLSRKHGIKLGAGSSCNVEDVALAVGERIGHSSVKSAARMNRAVVLFLEKVEQVKLLVETGVTVNGLFEAVQPLTQPAARITLSNVPPFISDEFLLQKLSRHGKVVSPIRKLLSGCKSPLLRHVVSHRRQVYMILNNRAEEFNYRFIVRVDDFDYTLFATSSEVKCFGCGAEGHLVRACPNRAGSDATGPVATAAAPNEKPVPAPRRRNSGDPGGAGPSREEGAKEQEVGEKKGGEVEEMEEGGSGRRDG